MSYLEDEMSDEDAARVDAVLQRADAKFVAAVEAKVDVEGSLARLKARNQLSKGMAVGIFVSYSATDGGAVASALVKVLREHGLDVVWDGDLSTASLLSVPSWMEASIRNRTVLCVMSAEYLRAWNTDGRAHVGAAFETSLLRHRIYEHGFAEGCPVVPVVPPEFDARSVPSVLACLAFHRFDPNNGDVSALMQRLRMVQSAPITTRAAAPALRTSHEIGHELRVEDPRSERAWKLVHELLASEDGDSDLAECFEQAVAVAKERGDVALVRQITQRCAGAAAALEREHPTLPAKILIFGQAWHLQREHRLPAAIAAAEEGVRLAEGSSDSRTHASGLQTVAKLYLKLAEHGQSFDRDFHLRTSSFWMKRAIRSHHDLHGPADSGAERSAEFMAEWNFVRHMITGDSADLNAALERLDIADSLDVRSSRPDRRTLLRARINLRKGKLELAASLLAEVLDDQAHPEVEAHGHRVLADVLLRQGERDLAVSELLRAMELFQVLGADHAADSCWWVLVQLAPERVTRVRLNPHDLEPLAELTDDPRIRRRAVEEDAKLTMMRLFPGRPVADWASLADDALYR